VMNTTKIPGFTAERSIKPAHGRFRAVAYVSFVSAADVRLQMQICHRDSEGNLVCVNPTCRLHCYLTKKGAALRACLDDC
jgi:hypothetical protein